MISTQNALDEPPAFGGRCFHCGDNTKPYMIHCMYPPLVPSHDNLVEFLFCAFCTSICPLILIDHKRVVYPRKVIVYIPIYHCRDCTAVYTMGCNHFGDPGRLEKYHWTPIFDSLNDFEKKFRMTDKQLRGVHILMLLIVHHLYFNGDFRFIKNSANDDTPVPCEEQITRNFMQQFNNFDVNLDLFIDWGISRMFLRYCPQQRRYFLRSPCIGLYIDIIESYEQFKFVYFPRYILSNSESIEISNFEDIQITGLVCVCGARELCACNTSRKRKKKRSRMRDCSHHFKVERTIVNNKKRRRIHHQYPKYENSGLHNLP